ncbi:MAG: tetratricopeptide repeat protein [Verrucomicrobia bacterium]|nr:tetratricopeptide repeat protein [Verrucomicrobiota bacterium]
MVGFSTIRLLLASTLVLVATAARSQESIGFYTTVAQDQYSRREYTLALPNFSQAIILWPNDSPLYKARGDTYRKLRLYTQALSDYTPAIILFPDDDGYEIRGDTYFELQHYEQAVADYTKCLDLKPDDAFAVCPWSLVYGVFRQYRYAIDWYADYLRQCPNDHLSYAQVYRKRGESYLRLKECDKAMSDYAIASVLAPDDSAIYRDLIFAAKTAKLNQE